MLDLLLGPELDPTELPDGERLPAEIRVRRSGWLTRLAGALLGRGRRVGAVTLGRTIVLAPEARLSARLLRHELAHVRQWRLTPFFPLRYVLEHVRRGYRDNPYEVEARAAESAAAQEHTRTRRGR